MKQLTDEIRRQIFQQNIGSEVAHRNQKEILTNKSISTLILRNWSILKRPLSSITDEEENKLSDILDIIYPEYYLDGLSRKTKYVADCLKSIHAYQYLHSIGIALPYLDWSVEELIKENVYKII